MKDENIVDDNSNTSGEVQPESTEDTEVETEETDEETIDDVKARLAKAEEVAKNYKVRAEKAEKKSKETSENSQKTDDLSPRDAMAIINAKVPEEDIDEVVDFAKYKKIPISEALKSTTVKTLLAERAEQRSTAQATNTGTARRSSVKLTDDVLIANANSGKLPESQDDIDRLVRAKMFEKK